MDMTLAGLSSLCENLPAAADTFAELRDACLRYAETVCAFHESRIALLADVSLVAEHGARDAGRHRAHSAMIDAANILARARRRQGRASAWIAELFRLAATTDASPSIEPS